MVVARCALSLPTRFIYLLFVSALLMAFLQVTARETFPGTLPYSPGERLTFDVKWGFIPAGQLLLEVHPNRRLNGVPLLHFAMVARTNSFADLFYSVRDRIDSFADSEMGGSILYFKDQKEGKHERRVVVTFDWENRQAQYTCFGETADPISILPGSFDPLALFYAFRLCELEEDLEIKTPVTNGRECVVSSAKVVRRENLALKDAIYDTYLVEVSLGQVSGVLEKTKDAKQLLIWVTADQYRIPLRITAKLSFGSCRAELVSVEGRGSHESMGEEQLAAQKNSPVEITLKSAFQVHFSDREPRSCFPGVQGPVIDFKHNPFAAASSVPLETSSYEFGICPLLFFFGEKPESQQIVIDAFGSWVRKPFAVLAPRRHLFAAERR